MKDKQLGIVDRLDNTREKIDSIYERVMTKNDTDVRQELADLCVLVNKAIWDISFLFRNQ